MAAHLSLRSGNPVLTADTFRPRAIASGREVMTVEGTAAKTALALVVLVAAASWTWQAAWAGDPSLGIYTMAGILGGLVVAMVTVFKKEWAPATTPLYAALEGLALGGISATFEARYPGIVMNAVLCTMGTLGALLAAYRSGVIRATENLKLGIVAATGGIMMVYLVGFVLRRFGSGIPFIHDAGPVGIGFSLIVVGVAALNLVLDFDFIEAGAERGAPKYMEWYGAFGLLVTLVWLYLEMLRLLAKLQDRR